jgi:pseudouridine kinase
VDVSHIIRTGQYPTGVYLAVVNARGQLQIALDDMRAIAEITPNYLSENTALFKEASMVFVDGNLSRQTLGRAVLLARRAGIPICADPTTAVLANRLRPHLSKLTLVTPNNSEAGVLCDRQLDPMDEDQTIEAAKYLVSQGVQIAILTLAEYGVCYATSQTSGKLPAISTEIIDPTGGGDALTAAVLFGLLNDIPLDDAIRLGVSAATLTLRYPGAVIPELTLEKLYDQLVI